MSEEATTTTPPPTPAPIGDVTARAGRYYRNTRYALAAGLIFYSVLSIRDGFFKWPAENQKDLQVDPLAPPRHSDVDLLFNKVLGILLPPASLLMLGWALYNSRGQIRLKDEVLNVPGHPPIPLDKIESVDKAKWDRKGIAFVTYRTSGGQAGKFKLDDFVYQRSPIDQIFQQIEQSIQAPKPAKPAAPALVPPPPSSRPRANFPPPPPRPRLGR
jgi:hypothetical protein